MDFPSKVLKTFQKLTSEDSKIETRADSLRDKLHTLRDSLGVDKTHAIIDKKFIEAFERVEECLKDNPDKLANFTTILADWKKASQQMRARAENIDPFIKKLWEAMKDIVFLK